MLKSSMPIGMNKLSPFEVSL